MKKAYCMKCQKVTDAVLVDKRKDMDKTETQCLICENITCSIIVRNIKLNPDEWRQE